MTGQPMPSEQDFHDYVDGRLDADERARIAAYLARHPEAASRLESYRAQIAGLHALYDRVLDEPIPERLSAPLRRRFPRRLALALALPVLIALSMAAGWWLNAAVKGAAAAGTIKAAFGTQR